eukprot:m.153390 g.153390  ORF g.153390 m.153390 type:complete len:61 (-) comp14287_c3_seq1:2058-2240(-)
MELKGNECPPASLYADGSFSILSALIHVAQEKFSALASPLPSFLSLPFIPFLDCMYLHTR